MTSGHRLKDVVEYTLPQVARFLELAGRRRARELEEMAAVARMAHHGRDKDFAKFMKQLRRI